MSEKLEIIKKKFYTELLIEEQKKWIYSLALLLKKT